ncbi:Cathepsin_B [Hexamita inflata]|uniref:Cathepsin_B n=1 Tax=Hexamita inflata TaxID=28002 RepID=A0ABP1H470_9EUKA
MQQALVNGPITVLFNVYEDFMFYTSGIYEHSYGEFLEFHRGEVVGYDEEGGVEYWKIKLSFGHYLDLTLVKKDSQEQSKVKMKVRLKVTLLTLHCEPTNLQKLQYSKLCICSCIRFMIQSINQTQYVYVIQSLIY